MKRREVEKYLQQHECYLLREGAKHSVFVNAANNESATVPRHGEIDTYTLAKICKQLGIPPPRKR